REVIVLLPPQIQTATETRGIPLAGITSAAQMALKSPGVCGEWRSAIVSSALIVTVDIANQIAGTHTAELDAQPGRANRRNSLSAHHQTRAAPRTPASRRA